MILRYNILYPLVHTKKIFLDLPYLKQDSAKAAAGHSLSAQEGCPIALRAWHYLSKQ